MPSQKFLDDAGLLHMLGAMPAGPVVAGFVPRITGPFAGCSTLEQLVTRLESIFAGNTSITGINVS